MTEQKIKTTTYFRALKDKEAQAIHDWYQWLHHDKQKGVRARLKRCASLDEVIIERGFLRLNHALPLLSQYELMGVALIAGLLAVTEITTGDDKDRDKVKILAEALGRAKKGSDNPQFSELRFQRLLASSTDEHFFQNVRRAIILVGKKVEPLALADSLLHWHKENQNQEEIPSNRKWQYITAKDYYTEIFEHKKRSLK